MWFQNKEIFELTWPNLAPVGGLETRSCFLHFQEIIELPKNIQQQIMECQVSGHLA